MTETTVVARLGPSILIGAATGLRSTSGLAALCLAGPSERLSPFLRRPAVRAGSALAAAGELVGDQLPSAPARTEPSGLIPRIVLGAVSARELSRGTDTPASITAALGGAAAVGAAFGGLVLRRRLAARIRPFPAAVIEDVVCGALAAGALWLAKGAAEPSADEPDRSSGEFRP